MTCLIVRSKATEAIAVVMRFLPQLISFYEDQKDSLKSAIGDAFKKYEGEAAPVPVRGPVVHVAQPGPGGDAEPEGEEEEEVDLMPRSDISDKFTDELLQRLEDKNWKERREALAEIKDIFEKNKFITGNLGDGPAGIAKRLGDVNKVLVQTTIEITILMAAALGAKNAKPGFGILCLHSLN